MEIKKQEIVFKKLSRKAGKFNTKSITSFSSFFKYFFISNTAKVTTFFRKNYTKHHI